MLSSMLPTTDRRAALYEHTVKRRVSVSGIGLHSGVEVSMCLAPSASGRGVVFVRTDLDGFEIPASWRYVAKVSYATSLMRQGVLLSTTEHLLSVLRAVGIDNVRVEISDLELPILDGSARPFADLIFRAGIQRQRRRKRYMRVLKHVGVVDGDKRISIEPWHSFTVMCETLYPHPQVGPQRLELELTPQTYLDEVAPARTFGFERDLDAMRDLGLIRGASLDSAVCFSDSGVLNEGGLRFRDEPCRHKLLDLIGDLALLGHSVIGKVVAARAGHAMHVALVDRIMNDPTSYEIVMLDQPGRAAGAPSR